MDSRVKILLWERWKETRFTVITAYILPLLGWFLHMSRHLLPSYFGTIAIYMLWCVGYMILTMTLLTSHCKPQDLDISFSKRLFRYPVSTMTLFLVYMGYGIIAIALQYCIFGLLLDTTTHTWANLLWFETVYMLVQTLSWISWWFESRIRLLFISLIFMCLFVCSILLFQNLDNPFSENIILCPIIILFCTTISFFSITAHRHNAGISYSKWIDTFLGIFQRNPSKPFKSALQAQIWFEMRQTGYLFPATALCITGLLLIWWIFIFNPPVLFIDFVPSVFTMILPAAFIGSFLIILNSGASSFSLRRPMLTNSLSVAKLHSMIYSLLGTLAVLAVITLVVAIHNWITGTLPVERFTPVAWALKCSSPLEIISMTILGILGFVFFYWIILSLSLPLSGILGINILISLVLIFSGIFGSIPGLKDSVETLGVIGFFIVSLKFTLYVLPVIALITFYIAKRRDLISNAAVIYSFCIFPVAVLSLWAFPWWGMKSEWFQNSNNIILLICVGTLPFLPVALTPLIMDILRHR